MAEAALADQTGKFALITGATGGLGLATAEALAAAGADVLLTGRDADKGVRALSAIRSRHSNALVRFELLDMSSKQSIGRFIGRYDAHHRSLDVLICNAGVMALPRRLQNADGVELQFATNYLGHFALTAGLIPALTRSKAPRVVQVSSIVARQGTAAVANPEQGRTYRPMQAYVESKLAQLIFMVELQRRSDRTGWGLTAVAAHPGVTRTDLLANGPGRESLRGMAYGLMQPLVSQPIAAGIQPILKAATGAGVMPLDYYGPSGPLELRGLGAAPARLPELARNEALGSRLWRLSEDLTDTRFPVLAAVS